MCGIVGYIGEENCANKLIEGLKRLEYRGYDSAGIALFYNEDIEVIKSNGRISALEEKWNECGIDSCCGIGHTRWATHGKPSDFNAHPHKSSRGLVTLVHNGIIENYAELKSDLVGEGYTFLSETDTEIAANVLDSSISLDGEGFDPKAAIRKAIKRFRGYYALGMLFKGYEDRIFAIKKENPLIIGVNKGSNFIASDISAILKWTKDYIILGTDEIAEITKDTITVYDENGDVMKKEIKTADWDYEAAEKGGYAHFMLKEICEQPNTLKNTISPRIESGIIDFAVDGLNGDYIKNAKRVRVVACGSAMHAGFVGKSAIEKLARIPVEVDIASEFRYADPIIEKGDLVFIISQSGETADSLAALRMAKDKGALTVAVVNVVASSIAREADLVIYTRVGPEIAVATTKAYSAQATVMGMLAVYMGYLKGLVSDKEMKMYVDDLIALPDAIDKLLDFVSSLKPVSARICEHHDVFYIGRGIDYSVSMEGSLKLKEISYIHSEAYAAGELKHGTISLITEETPIIAVATSDAVFEKTISNIKETKARGAYIILMCKEGVNVGKDIADEIISLPVFSDIFMPIPTVVACQILSYNVAVMRGCDVDKPRNLAKSVTVE